MADQPATPGWQGMFPGWENMPPEQRQALVAQWMSLGGLNEKKASLQDQIAQAQAMGKPSGRQYYGLGAGILGGLGDVLGAIGSTVKEGRLRGESDALQPQIDEARATFGKVLTGPSVQPNATVIPGGYVDGPPGPTRPAMDDDPTDYVRANPPNMRRTYSPFGYGPGLPWMR